MTHAEIEAKLREISNILSASGLSFFVAVHSPMDTPEGVKPFVGAASFANPLQGNNLLTAVWTGVGQFVMTGSFDTPVSGGLIDAHFRVGAETAKIVCQVCQQQQTASGLMALGVGSKGDA